FSNVAFSAPSSSEKHSSLVKRQECPCTTDVQNDSSCCLNESDIFDCEYCRPT
ncbi:13191_t:CDS:1, partial [Funneliformis caledonium]